MIAVDWGGSRLRAYRLDGQGNVLASRQGAWGALECGQRFDEVLVATLGDWDDSAVVMCGMIGARGGWHEMPYLACPIGIDEIARGLQRLPGGTSDGRDAWLVPGLRCAEGNATPDVMRGEESQLAALLDAMPAGEFRVCLPGTHCKWVRVRDGRILGFSTSMTGEVYALLRHRSVLGRLMPAGDDALDGDAFDLGLERARSPGGLLRHVFEVRTAALFDRLPPSSLSSFLSGLLIGHELRGTLEGSSAGRGPVHLVGSQQTLEPYARALARQGMEVERHAEDLVARGLHGIWARRASSP
ncbi:2-dehydro-3-deoxygalactonokinase [Lysobacter sp. SG-8]|uniref:2-dehydro-3-deoxygalactonokinase n=1 Tax=Marilutibacter penaei TaxID=2759900 RepID=A0A7W3U138_9GAMM|nr:2-dehydro-3-deoxygalactonokinase [Lysobacter penaei]MBB1086982.1 2-dehydro-3-deoxygalactonokinase [Lysobacter penaei]